MKLYLTADVIGSETGGGLITQMESKALTDTDGEPAICVGRDQLLQMGPLEKDPWGWDDLALKLLDYREFPSAERFHHLHVYAGTFTKTVQLLKSRGATVSYTAAAHDVAKSKAEHEALGIEYNFPHLTDPFLFKHYVGGYLQSDLIICPSEHSRSVMESYGATNVHITSRS